MTQAELELVMAAVDERDRLSEARVHRSFAHAVKQIVQRIPAQVRADLYGTVVESNETTTSVTLDVDGTTIDAYPLGQHYTAGDRVVILFTPPSLALILGVLGPSITDPLTLSAEFILDTVAAALTPGAGIDIAYDDPGDQIVLTNTAAAAGEPFVDMGVTAGSVILDYALAHVFKITMAGAIDLHVVNTIPGRACGIELYLAQDSIGGRTVTWMTGTRWPGGTDPTLSVAGNATDIVVAETLDDGGSWFANLGGLAYAP